tara:strand:+ start:2307 stop:2675 length:369 start_codon:yes stop_codon:yes gene_type:complete
MEIKLTKETKDIKRTKEHSISIKNLENDGVGYDFLFRSVEENGKTNQLLFPFGKHKWSKTPNKEIFEHLKISKKVLFTILTEFIALETEEDQIIVSLTLDDFRHLDPDTDLEDPDSVFNEDD